MLYLVNTKQSVRSLSRYLGTVAIAGFCSVATALAGCSSGDDEAQAELAKQQADAAAQRVADSIEQVNDSILLAEQVVADSLAAIAEAEALAAEMPAHQSLETQWGVYTVQIGSYDSRELAMPFYDKLVARGLNPYLIDEMAIIDGEERIVYRLRFGEYSSKDEAHNRGSEVALKYELDYWVDNLRR